MRRVEAITAAAMALALAGCVLRGKQPAKAAAPAVPAPVAASQPAPPPRQLSVPQTNVELPAPQPVNLEALTQPPAPEEPAPAAIPAGGRAGPPRRPTPAAAPKPEAPAPQPPTTGPVQPPEAEAPRPPIQEIVAPEEQKRFQETVATGKKEIQQRLDQIQSRNLNRTEKQLVNRIYSFLKQSDAAAARGDWRGAAELADRGLALAKDLSGGR